MCKIPFHTRIFMHEYSCVCVRISISWEREMNFWPFKMKMRENFQIKSKWWWWFVGIIFIFIFFLFFFHQLLRQVFLVISLNNNNNNNWKKTVYVSTICFTVNEPFLLLLYLNCWLLLSHLLSPILCVMCEI